MTAYSKQELQNFVGKKVQITDGLRKSEVGEVIGIQSTILGAMLEIELEPTNALISPYKVKII